MLSGSEGYCWSLFVSHDFFVVIFLPSHTRLFPFVFFLHLIPSSTFVISLLHLNILSSSKYFSTLYLLHISPPPMSPFHLSPTPITLSPAPSKSPPPSPLSLPHSPFTRHHTHIPSIFLTVSASFPPHLPCPPHLSLSFPCSQPHHPLTPLRYPPFLLFYPIFFFSSSLFFYLSHPNLSISRSCFFLVFFSF